MIGSWYISTQLYPTVYEIGISKKLLFILDL